MDIQKQKELIDIIVNRLNPRYKKEIVDIPNSVVPRELFKNKELKSKFNLDNLRGLGLKKEDFPTCDVGNSSINSEELLTELPKMHLGIVRSIIKIDEQTIACGGEDSKITLIDISDKKSPKELGGFALSGIVFSIIKIDEQTIACGGDDSKIRLIDISNKENPKELGGFALSNWVESIIKIDEQTIACGGRDKKITLIDISNKENPKELGGFALSLSLIHI